GLCSRAVLSQRALRRRFQISPLCVRARKEWLYTGVAPAEFQHDARRIGQLGDGVLRIGIQVDHDARYPDARVGNPDSSDQMVSHMDASALPSRAEPGIGKIEVNAVRIRKALAVHIHVRIEGDYDPSELGK